MKILGTAPSRKGQEDYVVTVVTTRNELVILADALGECLEAIEEWEFFLRLGVTPEEARVTRSRIEEILLATLEPE